MKYYYQTLNLKIFTLKACTKQFSLFQNSEEVILKIIEMSSFLLERLQKVIILT